MLLVATAVPLSYLSVFAAADQEGAPPAAPDGLALATRYASHWSTPPVGVPGPGFPDGPILGNGDLGATLAADPSRGQLVMHLGLSQLWGIGAYQHPDNDPIDYALPRRLGLGGITVASSALLNATFRATQDIARGEVTATLSNSQGSLSLRSYLHPEQNVLVLELNASESLPINISSWVLPLARLCRHTPTTGGGDKCITMDGKVDAGGSTSNGALWSVRQPLGASSPRPIEVAVATQLVQPYSGFSCGAVSSTNAQCAGHLSTNASPLTVVTAVLTNWDLCDTPNGCAEPLPSAQAVAAAFKTNKTALAGVSVANMAFWAAFWAHSWMSLPHEPLLEAFYYRQSYMIGSASRGTKIAVGLWGPWAHQDSMYCAGCDFTMDYNYQAVYWGLYATNRLAQTQSQPAAILAFEPKARARAAHFNCSGLHYPGDMGPLGYLGLKGQGDMAIQSNGLLTALNFIQQWEYGRNLQFLRSVAFPFARDALAFYICWMTRSNNSGVVSWANTMDQSHECSTPLPQTEEKRKRLCYQNNSVLANGLIRRVASALPSMARAAAQDVDPVWLEVAQTLVAPPTALTNDSRRVFVLAGTYDEHQTDEPPPPGWCSVNDGQNCGTRTCPPCKALPPGAQNIPAWQIWPAEAVNIASDSQTLSVSMATLSTMSSWDQGNSFCGVYSQAARVGMPLSQWLPQLRATLTANTMGNGVVSLGPGTGGAEVVGATQALADIMLQSVTPTDGSGISWAVLFPITTNLSSMSFFQLRAKGAFAVSAGWDADKRSLAGPAEVLSEAGERFRLWLPWLQLNASSVRVTDIATNADVSLLFDARGRMSFDTKVGRSYNVRLSSI